jgi:hypothetical protein
MLLKTSVSKGLASIENSPLELVKSPLSRFLLMTWTSETGFRLSAVTTRPRMAVWPWAQWTHSRQKKTKGSGFTVENYARAVRAQQKQSKFATKSHSSHVRRSPGNI